MSESTQIPARRPTRRRALRLARTIAAPLLVAALVTAGSPGWGLYTIKQGDTLSDIAARYHTTVAKLVQVNRLPGNGNLIIAGRALEVPGGGRTSHSTSSGGNTFAGRTYSSSVVSAADRTRAQLARRHLPSQAGMRTIIVAKARANGVDPALALAVSYQESGWNMHVVSVANAVGAMQVIPATSVWISGVVGRRLDPTSPSDNATTGVVLLKILTRAASSERQAVAAYYQGMRSVRANGLFADTRQYVANVMALKARFE